MLVDDLMWLRSALWYCCFGVVIAKVSIISHTHPFNGPFSRTTWVSRYQKGKANLDFTEARDSEQQWYQLDHMQVCTLLQTDNHASTPPLSFFYRLDALPATQLTAVKALKARARARMHTHTHTHNHLTAFCPWQSTEDTQYNFSSRWNIVIDEADYTWGRVGFARLVVVMTVERLHCR